MSGLSTPASNATLDSLPQTGNLTPREVPDPSSALLSEGDDGSGGSYIQEEDESDYLWGRRSSVIYNARLSILYHLKRERFFDFWDKFVSMITALSATTAVGAILKDSPEITIVVAVFTAILSLIPLVFNPAERARRHGLLASEFRRLFADAEREGEYWTATQCDKFAARISELEIQESAPRTALVIECQNQLAIAGGQPEKVVPLNWWERTFIHWSDFSPRMPHKIDARA